VNREWNPWLPGGGRGGGRLRPRICLLLLGIAGGCAGNPSSRVPGEEAPRVGDEIVACGRFFHVGAPVVLWMDPRGYDAYRVEPRFPEEVPARTPPPAGPRYASLRKGLPEDLAAKIRKRGWTLPELQGWVSQFVVHYDVCGTSRQCFKVLQDRRGLSVHFMLDVDGTIYQTLDLKERAWHAGKANERSIGIEIAQIGAYPSPDHEVLRSWYRRVGGRVRIRFPSWMDETGIRGGDGPFRPAREALQSGVVQGRRLYQYDFTEAQYRSLARLLAALNRIFPRIRLDAPRNADGKVRDSALSAEELADFEGVLGHYHVTTRKIDPGPAFDWNRVLREARDLRWGRTPR